jgi:hypothetical protein
MKKADKRDNQLSFSLDTAASAKRPAAGSTAKVNVVRLDDARVQKARKFLMEQLSKAGLR